jgi:uncharacterized membrane protein
MPNAGMNLLIIGILLFFGIHLVPVLGFKPALVQRLGEGRYKGVFALVSLAGFVLMIWGFRTARLELEPMLYEPPRWGRHVAMLLVLLAVISLMAAFHRGRLKLWLKQPMSIGIALWATGHLFANGSLPEVLLFGSFLVFSLVDIIRSNALGEVPAYVPKPVHDVIAVVGGLVIYGLLLYLHPIIIGVPVV